MPREDIRTYLGLLGLHCQHLNLQAPGILLSSTGCKLMPCLPLCDYRDHKSARVMTPHQLAEFISSVSYAIPVQHLQLDSQPMTPAAWRTSPRIHERLCEGLADTYFISSVQSVHGFSSFLAMLWREQQQPHQGSRRGNTWTVAGRVPDTQLKQQGVKCIKHDRQSSPVNMRKDLKNPVSIKEYPNY